MKHKTSSLILFLLMALPVRAQELSLETIWESYKNGSHELKALEHELEANSLAKVRGDLHWLPRVYVTGQWFATNDPGQVFFNNLGQREISQMDFNPADLNRPGTKTFKAGALGVDLPLYEGGMKVNQSSLLGLMLKASEVEARAKRTSEYGELSRHYGSMLIHQKGRDHLKALQDNLKKIMAGYEVGAKSNPVGYSGLLGLKGVANRIEGMLIGFELQLENDRNWINEKASLTSRWSPDSKTSFEAFLNEAYRSLSGESISSELLAASLKAQTLDLAADMEKARFRPRVGLFAQNNLYAGDRATENSQSVGLYVMWDLFNPDSYNRSSEARAKAQAAESKIRWARQEESLAYTKLMESKAALEKGLILLDNSDTLLGEQSANAMKLFRSGMMGALQLAEVMNRRIDVIEEKTKAQKDYLEIRSRLYQLRN